MITSLISQTDGNAVIGFLVVYLSVIFLVALCFGLGGQAIGRTNGRERAGFWLGFLLGPFGIVTIAVLSRTPEAEAVFILERDAATQRLSHRAQTQAAWHADPVRRHELRYWDGRQWTGHVSDAGQKSTDKLG